jgi:hypothetical protein
MMRALPAFGPGSSGHPAFTLDRYTHSTAGSQDRVQAAIEARLTGNRNPLQLVEGGADDADDDSCDHSVTNPGVSAPDPTREAL